MIGRLNEFYEENKVWLWIVTITILILFSFKYGYAYTCYQEFANSTECNNTIGSSILSSNSLISTYNIPNGTINATWIVDMNIGLDNITIPSECMNNNITVKIITNTGAGSGSPVYRDITLQCYNGTNYTTLVYNYTNITCGLYSAISCDFAYDGNHSVYGSIYTPSICRTINCNVHQFSDEGMLWNIQSTNQSNQSNQTNCTPLWVNNNTACNGYNYTIQYFDFYQCNVTTGLPVNNGTIVPCSLNVSACAENLCINPIFANTSCCIVTPVVTCASYTYELYNSDAVLIQSGLMLPFVNNTYYYMFQEDIGTYYTKICDDSTRQLIVEGDNMIGLTSQTWFLIMIVLLFILFLWLSIRVDILFLVLDGIIFVYLGYYTYTLFSSWFVTVMVVMVGILFMIFGVMGKIGETTK